MNINRKQVSATASGIQKSDGCFVCNKPIVDNTWFCRLPKKTEGAAGSQVGAILLCSSVCALRYFGDSQPNGNGFERNYEGFERSLPVPGGRQKTESVGK